MAQYDNSDDSDVPFTVSLGVTDSLTVLANNGLTVWGGDTFAPDGEVTLTAGGAGGVSDGAFTVRSGATYQAAAGESLSIGGSVLLESGSTFTPSTASVLLTATSTGRTIATQATLGQSTIFRLPALENGSFPEILLAKLVCQLMLVH